MIVEIWMTIHLWDSPFFIQPTADGRGGGKAFFKLPIFVEGKD